MSERGAEMSVKKSGKQERKQESSKKAPYTCYQICIINIVITIICLP